MTPTGRDRIPGGAAADSPGVGMAPVALALLAFASVWTIYFAITESGSSAHHDMLEAYAWGREFQLGYSKHPPFWSWMCGAWFSIFPRSNASFAALTSLNAAIGLLGAWKAAGAVSTERRTDATLLLLLTPFYTFLSFKYNANSIFLSIWPWSIFFFLRALQTRTYGYTLGLGAMMGIAALSKYYVTVLAGALLVAALISPERKRYFGSPSPYVSVAITALVFAPHFVWLLESSAPTLQYLSHASGRGLALVTADASLTLAGAIAQNGIVLLLIAFLAQPSVSRIAANWRSPDVRILAALALGPLALTVIAAFLLRTKVSTNMTIATFPLLPLFALEFVGADRERTRKLVRTMAVIFTIVPLLAAPIVLYVKSRNSHAPQDIEPRQELAAAATEFWRQSTGKPLLYVGGSDYYDMAVAFYSAERPHAFLNLSYDRSAWVTPAKLAESGLLVVCLKDDEACRTRGAELANPLAVTTEMTLQHNSVGHIHRPFDFVVTAIPPANR